MRQGGELLIAFGTRVRDLRLKLGLSQEELATESGLDRTYVSGIECGKRNVALLNVAALARSLGVSVSELTKGL